MKHVYFLSTLLFCAAASACPGAHAEHAVALVIPNFEAKGPACHIKVDVKVGKCADQSCTFPAANGASGASPELRFTCFPASAPTGFENPAPYAKIKSIQTKSAKGAVSIIDDITTPAAVRKQELNFCLYGAKSNLCGSAKVAKISGKESPTVGQIIALIRRIEWDDAARK